MAALVSNWRRHFPLLLWNRWTEFNETWQEGRSQRPLPCLCFFFSGWSEKEDGPDLWFAETFLYSSQKALNRIQRNLKGIKILMPMPSLFLGRSENKIVVPVSDWLRHFRLLPLNCWTEFKETWQKASSQCPLPCLCFSDRSDWQSR